VGNIFADFLLDRRREERYYHGVYVALGLQIVTGIANYLYMRQKVTMGCRDKEIWKSAVYYKAGLSILITPIPSIIADYMNLVLDTVSFNFYMILLLVILSSFSKQWREEQSNKSKYDSLRPPIQLQGEEIELV
jgi:hypothetical protein